MSAALSGKRIAGLELVQEGKVFFWRSGGTVNYELFGKDNGLHTGTMRWLHDSGYIAAEGEHGKVGLTGKGAAAVAKELAPA